MDSLDTVEIVMAIEESFDVEMENSCARFFVDAEGTRC
jgi:acyl carrier protein